MYGTSTQSIGHTSQRMQSKIAAAGETPAGKDALHWSMQAWSCCEQGSRQVTKSRHAWLLKHSLCTPAHCPPSAQPMQPDTESPHSPVLSQPDGPELVETDDVVTLVDGSVTVEDDVDIELDVVGAPPDPPAPTSSMTTFPPHAAAMQAIGRSGRRLRRRESIARCYYPRSLCTTLKDRAAWSASGPSAISRSTVSTRRRTPIPFV